MYRAAVSAFAGVVEVDLPHAIGLLHRMSENLEAYVGMAPPDLARALSPPEGDSESMRRTGTTRADMEPSESHPEDTLERTEDQEPRP